MSDLTVEGLDVSLSGRPVVKRASFGADLGQVSGLVGANGVGKSTLLRAIAGLIPSSAGTIFWNGRPIDKLSPALRARTITYLPQGQAVHWRVSVRHLVALGRLPHLGPLSRMTPADEMAIERAMLRTNILHLADKSAMELSGGERSRAMLARVLAVEAPIVLADEPTAALDPFHQLEIIGLLRQLAGDGTLVLAVLHDLSLAARFCDRILLMKDGAIVSDGTPRDVLNESGLAQAYRVGGYYAEYENQMIALPWQQLLSQI